MPDTIIEVAALNLVASPHPKGIYRRFLETVADREVGIWGSDRAKITTPQEIKGRDGVLWGHILVWAEIDKDSPWLNKSKNSEATPAEKQAAVDAIPSHLEPNFRNFYYAFSERNHRLLFETRNEFGKRLSPKRAERLFEHLARTLPSDFSSMVEATVIPEDEALSAIFAIPRLRRLEIFVKRPNADDVGSEFSRVMNRLTAEGARSQKVELVKAPKIKTLTPDADRRMLAEIAAANGYVIGEGKDAAGKPVYESTAEHPKIRILEVNTSTFAAFLSGIPLFE